MKPKVAVWIEGGMVQGIRASIDIDVEILDLDVDLGGHLSETYDYRAELEKKWDSYQLELPFGIF